MIEQLTFPEWVDGPERSVPVAECVKVTIPTLFYEDHVSRDLTQGVIVKAGKLLTTLWLDRQGIRDLASDADYFAGFSDLDYEYNRSICDSARTTLRRLQAAVPEIVAAGSVWANAERYLRMTIEEDQPRANEVEVPYPPVMEINEAGGNAMRKKLSEMTPDELIARMREQCSTEIYLSLQTVKNARAQLRRITGLDNEDIGHLFTSGLTYAEWLEDQARQDAPENQEGITATRATLYKRNGEVKGYAYFVFEDGVERESARRTSHRLYTHVHVQRWKHDSEAWAARYTSTPKAIGSKLEYGFVADVIPIVDVDAPHNDAPVREQEEVIMASKTLTARESIEAAFAAGQEKKLKAAQVVERVLANPKSKISQGTIRTQLHRQGSKGEWIKKVGAGTFQLVPAKTAAANGSPEAKSDPKPKTTRKRSAAKKVETAPEPTAPVEETVEA